MLFVLPADPARRWLRGRGLEHDGIAELLEPFHVAFHGSFLVSFVVELRTEIFVLLIAGEKVVDDDQNVTSGGDDGFVSADAKT